MTITELVASNIKKTRIKKGMTQADIARLMNVEESVYNKIENGKIMISLDKLGKVAEHIKKPISHFFEGIVTEEDNTKPNKITYGESLILNILEDIKSKIK
jgi:transcriptional regulator with XRE-family HTH domain